MFTAQHPPSISEGTDMKALRLCVLVVVTMLTLCHRGMATDLRPVEVRFPYGPTHALAMTQLAVLVANENRLPALTYLVALQIVLRGTGQTVYSTTLEGRFLREYTQAVLVSQLLWRPLVAGQYDVTATVTFDDEINPGNNTLTQPFTVLPPLLVAAMYWQRLLAPSMGDATSWAVFRHRMAPSAVWRYLNLRFLTDAGAWFWLVRNRPVPPTADSLALDMRIDLSTVIGATVPDSIDVAIGLADSTISTDTVLKGYTTVPYGTLNIVRGGVEDSTPPPSIAVAAATSPPAGSAPRDGLYIGCAIPNMDLDASWFNASTFPEYAGDKNACGPTAAANSMEWLEKTFPAIRSGLHHREKLKELSYAMRRYVNEGVFSEDFLLGKLEYINAYDLPISVKFQGRGQTANVESEDDYVSTAVNRGDGGYPTWEFLKQEVKDSEDVEMFFEYHRDSADQGSSLKGRHAVVISGAYETGTSKEFWYKDDGDQDTIGGTAETACTWQNLPTGEPYFNPYFGVTGGVNISVPMFVCSESYDSTVHRKGRGGLERLWRGVKGLFTGPRVARDNSIDNDSLKPLRYSTVISQRLSKPVANVPVGTTIGSAVTVPIHDGYFSDPKPTSTVPLQIWYADSIGDGTPLRRFDHTYDVIDLGDSTRDAAPSDGTERWRSPVSNVPWPEWREGESTIVDSSVQWLRMKLTDMDSRLAVPSWGDSLTSYGSTPQVVMGDIFEAVDGASDSVALVDNMVARLESLTTLMKRTREGTHRKDLLEGCVLYVDQVRQPIRIRFQSASLSEMTVPAGTFGHAAVNETGPSGAPDISWILNAMDRSPLLVELGRYTPQGRISGTWVLVNGALRYNNGIRIIMDRDLGEGRSGGLRRTMNAVEPDGGALILSELSFGQERTIIETAVAINVDPTVVYTHVDEDERMNAAVAVRPNPAANEIHVHADLRGASWARIDLVDVQGQVIISRIVDASEILNGVRVGLEGAPVGMIGVRVLTVHGAVTRSIIHRP
jgi:hypothetical protein